jgi:hypothetical protein
VGWARAWGGERETGRRGGKGNRVSVGVLDPRGAGLLPSRGILLFGLGLDFFCRCIAEPWKRHIGDRKGLVARGSRVAICPPLSFGRPLLFDCVGCVGIAVAFGRLSLSLIKLSLDQGVQAVLGAEIGDAGVGANAGAGDYNDLPGFP